MASELATALWGALAVPLGLNVYATARIWRDQLLGRRQRIMQTLVTWAVPIVGALVVLWYLREERFELRRFESPGPDSDIGMTL